MGSRRSTRPEYDERSRQETETMRRGPLPSTHRESLPLPELLDNKLASQAAEIEQLTRDNHKLAAGHLALRQELVGKKGDVEKLRDHIRSIQNEGDVQIRILLDKIAKSEAAIRAGDLIKRELQEANIEARSVMKAKLELSVKIEQATKELEYSRANIKRLPEMRADLDSLKQEYQRLRKTFECEKVLNIEKVEQMRILERDLIAKVEELERLRGEVVNAERRTSAPIPYSGPYMHQDNSYPPPFYGNGGGYADNFGGPHFHTVHGAPVEMMHPYANGGYAVGLQAISGPVGGAAAPGGAGAGWGGVYSAPAPDNQM